MKKLPLLLLLVLTLPFTSQSQKHLVPGKVVTTGGDTLSGLIDFRDWEENPYRLRFKSGSGNMTVYNPATLRCFMADKDRIYVSRRLSIDLSAIRVEDLAADNSIRIVNDTALFVILLVNGKLNLYYLMDQKGKEHFWVQKGNDSIIELKVSKRLVESGGGTSVSDRSVATLNQYRLALPGIMADCPSIQEEIPSVGFSTEALKKLVHDYNECISPENLSFVAKERKTELKFGFVAGAGLGLLNFSGEAEGVPIGSVNFDQSWSYSVGVAMKIILPYLYRSWTIYNDLVYQPYTYNGGTTVTRIHVPGIYWDYDYHMKMGYLKLSTLLRYQYPHWSIKPFADLGISNSYAVLSQPDLVITERNASLGTTETTEKSAEDQIKRYRFGVVAGLGATVKGFGAEFRYEWAGGFSSNTTINSSQNSFTLLLSYTLGEK